MSKTIRILLGIIFVCVAIGALPAGYLMLAEPDGSGLGMTPEMLKGLPFKTYLIPGLFLFTVNGIFNLAGSLLCFFKSRFTAYAGLLLGAAMIIWISVQVYFLGLTHFLQPTFFFIGTAEIVLSAILYRQMRKTART